MKKINIFLASSIKELANERMIIENFIRNVSDGFEEHYNIKLQPLLCENFDDAYTKCRKQEEYNEKIRCSEFCFFIFFTKAGKYTKEEFDVARKQFEQTKKPRIYTYFQIVDGCELEESLVEFKTALDKTFGHYYGEFEHIDTVKLRILLGLKLQEMDFIEIKVEDSSCVVDGKKVMDLDNVSEFANNKELAKLQKELEKTEKEYYKLKPNYGKESCGEAFYKQYAAIASKRENLKKAIEELQGLIFNMSLRMAKDEVHGEITQRQKEAYRLFELGNYYGCISVLDQKDIDDDFFKERERLKKENTAICRRYIKEHQTAIDILTVMNDYKGRFDEIEDRYEKIVPIALEEKIELEVVEGYCHFLSGQIRIKKALELAYKLEEVYEEIGADNCVVASLYNLIGICCETERQFEEATKYYAKAIDRMEQLADEKTERYNGGLATIYTNVGLFYAKQGSVKKAKEYYNKAVEAYEQLATENPERYKVFLAVIYNNVGIFYANQNVSEQTEEFFTKAINIAKKLVNEDSERYNELIATNYNNAGTFYRDKGLFKSATEYYTKAIEIREKMAEENPERYMRDLAVSYNNAGNLYEKEGAIEKAEEFYKKTIVTYEQLAKVHNREYNGDLAASYNNVGNFYRAQGQMENSEKCYNTAIEIMEQLAKEKPEWYMSDLAVSYFNYAIFRNYDKYYFTKALECAKKQPGNPYCRQIIGLLQK